MRRFQWIRISIYDQWRKLIARWTAIDFPIPCKEICLEKPPFLDSNCTKKGAFLYRQQEVYIHSWFSRKKNRKPLILRGARQVEKSTLVRQFCHDHKIDLFEVNMEKSPHLNEVFKLNNPAKVIEAIEDILNVKITSKSKNHLLFLDEIHISEAKS